MVVRMFLDQSKQLTYAMIHIDTEGVIQYASGGVRPFLVQTCEHFMTYKVTTYLL